MDEIVNAVVQRTGISETQARTAVETVIRHLKERLPAPVASQLDNFVQGGGGSGGVGDTVKGLGGMFGNR